MTIFSGLFDAREYEYYIFTYADSSFFTFLDFFNN
jgi:hypothetical protein